jgi:hypothetical protein
MMKINNVLNSEDVELCERDSFTMNEKHNYKANGPISGVKLRFMEVFGNENQTGGNKTQFV